MPSSPGSNPSDQLKSVRGFAIQNLKMASPNTPAYELMRIFELMVANKAKPEVMKKLAQVPHVEEVIALIEKDGPEAAIVDFWLAYVDKIELMDFIRLLKEKLVVLLREELTAVLQPAPKAASPIESWVSQPGVPLPAAPSTADSTVALNDADLESVSIPPSAPVPPTAVSTDRPPTREGKVEKPAEPKSVVKPDEAPLARHVTGMSVVRQAEQEDAEKARQREEEARKKATEDATLKQQPKAPAGSSFFPEPANKGTDPGLHPKKGGTSARRRAAAASKTVPSSDSRPTISNPVDRSTALGADAKAETHQHQTVTGPDSGKKVRLPDDVIQALTTKSAWTAREMLKLLYENQNTRLVKKVMEFSPIIGVLIHHMNKQDGKKHTHLAIYENAYSGIETFVESVLVAIKYMFQTETVTELGIMIKEVNLVLDKEEEEIAPPSLSQTGMQTRKVDTAFIQDLCAKVKAGMVAEKIDVKDAAPRESRASLMPAAPAPTAPQTTGEAVPADDEMSFGDVMPQVSPPAIPDSVAASTDDETSFADLDNVTPAGSRHSSYESLEEPSPPIAASITEAVIGAVKSSDETQAHIAEILAARPSLSTTPPAHSSAPGNQTQNVDLGTIEMVWSGEPQRVIHVPSVIPYGKWIKGIMKPDEENKGKFLVEKGAALTVEVAHGGSEITLAGLNSVLHILKVAEGTEAQSITIYHPEGYNLNDEKNFSLPTWLHPFNIRTIKKG